MRSHWVHSEIGKRVLSYTLDPRPVWFWDEDGSRLLWRNLAARLFRTKAKKKRVKLLPDPVPLRGQINRLIRLGAHGRASLSRMRFQIGKKPVSTTCSCIPLINDELTGLLVISSDTIDPQLFSGDAYDLAASAQMFSPELDFVVVDDNHEVVAGTSVAPEGAPQPELAAIALDLLEQGATAQFDISSRAKMLVFEPGTLHDLAEMGADALPEAEEDIEPFNAEPEDGLLDRLDNDAQTTDASDQVEDHSTAEDDASSETEEPSQDDDDLPHDLTELIDHLYQADRGLIDSSDRLEAIEADELAEALADELDDHDEHVAAADVESEAEAPQLWTIRAKAKRTSAETEETSSSVASVAAPTPEPESVSEQPRTDKLESDRSARYNFEELSRVLRERVGSDEAETATETKVEETPAPTEPNDPPASEREAAAQLTANGIPENAMDAPANPQKWRPVKPKAPSPDEVKDTPEGPTVSGALVALSDETLVLNRLPLGILLFRDQELLFANRAMAELAGYKTSTELRQAGFDQIFPRADDGDSSVGPVTKLLRKDGTDVPVVARLQTTTWQGKSAYMLTAREDDRKEPIALPATADAFEHGDDELSVFAASEEQTQLDVELLKRIAEAQQLGLVVLDNRGHVNEVSETAEALIGPHREMMLDRTLMEYIDADSRSNYFGLLAGTKQESEVFLFAGAAHCAIQFLRHPMENGDNFQLIGLVREKEEPQSEQNSDVPDDLGTEAELLPLISREIRRPLATISGFNSLMHDEAYGPIGNDRYREYVKDIQLAAKRLERVVHELDDLSRYRDGSYELENAQVDLGDLLTQCIGKIRTQANAQQVFVRSAIPDAQYLVDADAKLLSQTIMNLLASAVTLSPPGSNVIISAIREDNGDVSVHVRDNGSNQIDRGEKFAVFHQVTEDGKETGTTASSAVGLSLTRSLARANSFGLSFDPLGENGMMMALRIPGHRVQNVNS
ncbi:signal transduction histidine kinase [Maritalea mobilis]|uniref:histidine kinase n=1 Tax=Maritalea mobilis TaxID=483324 RepID=A0A4R6VP33_9HYPH|nr:histidine kinase dimerization/phospho-acceptor domain-containing protein [Maritalea mobilis]TDQ64012.1 signal transduction histidine kinase [Maritalea mobilis]